MRAWRRVSRESGRAPERVEGADGVEMAIKRKPVQPAQGLQAEQEVPDYNGTTASGITAQSSHVGDASIADSETPLVKMASSASGNTTGQLQVQVPEVAYRPDDGHPATSGPSQSDTKSPHSSDDKPVAMAMAGGASNKKASKKRRIFRKNPISTVTSSILATRPRRKRADTDDSPFGAAGSQISDSVVIDGSGSKSVVAEVVSAHNSGSELDRELGHNDGKGTEGILQRVYDTWALTSLGVANIGPVAGQATHCVKLYALLTAEQAPSSEYIQQRNTEATACCR